jgi:hypothetical protein
MFIGQHPLIVLNTQFPRRLMHELRNAKIKTRNWPLPLLFPRMQPDDGGSGMLQPFSPYLLIYASGGEISLIHIKSSASHPWHRRKRRAIDRHQFVPSGKLPACQGACVAGGAAWAAACASTLRSRQPLDTGFRVVAARSHQVHPLQGRAQQRTILAATGSSFPCIKNLPRSGARSYFNSSWVA